MKACASIQNISNFSKRVSNHNNELKIKEESPCTGSLQSLLLSSANRIAVSRYLWAGNPIARWRAVSSSKNLLQLSSFLAPRRIYEKSGAAWNLITLGGVRGQAFLDFLDSSALYLQGKKKGTASLNGIICRTSWALGIPGRVSVEGRGMSIAKNCFFLLPRFLSWNSMKFTFDELKYIGMFYFLGFCVYNLKQYESTGR